MNKNIQPVNVPVTSKVSLAEVDDLIHNVDDPSFAEKNNLTYQGIMRNPHIDKGEGWITTTGKKLTVEGSYIVDDSGKRYSLGGTLPDIKESYKIPDDLGNSVITATMTTISIGNKVVPNRLFALYKENNKFMVNIYDAADNHLIKIFDIEREISLTSGDLFATISSSSSGEDSYLVCYSSNKILYIKLLYLTFPHDEMKTYLHTNILTHKNNDKSIVEVEGKNLGKTLTASVQTRFLAVGFDDDYDQSKRWTFIIDTQSEEENKIVRDFRFFGLCGNNKTTGEPIPIVVYFGIPGPFGTSDKYYEAAFEKKEDGKIYWDLKGSFNDSNYDAIVFILGWTFSPSIKPLIMEYVYKKDLDKISCSNNMSEGENITNVDGTITNTYISNDSKNRGIYFDYGYNWAKAYFREADVTNHTVCAGIYTSESYIDDIKKEYLFFGSKCIDDKQKYKEGFLNERCYTLGGNNIGNNSLLDVIPFTASILHSSFNVNVNLNVYGLVETSISIGNTLLSTPSEVKSKSYININEDVNSSTFIFMNGIIYQIGGNNNRINIEKIADYYFKINKTEGANLIKEDRNGNLTLLESFISYGMEEKINIGNLDFKVPDENVKEANDTWFEASGCNVNLESDNPSFSSLLPKIILPIYIDKDDYDSFSNLIKSNSQDIILKIENKNIVGDDDPTTSNSRKIDVYYTLQSLSTDCTYKYSILYERLRNSYDKYIKYFYDNDLKNNSWWIEDTGTVLFPIGIGSEIKGINYITPSVQLPQDYSCRLYTNANRLFMGFDYQNQIWNGATIFTIYGSNFYYDGQAIYFIGSDQDYTANNFVTYALGMKFLANSGSEAYFYSDFEKRLFIFSGSNTLSGAEYLSNIRGTIVDAVFSSKEQALYILTSEGEVIVRTQNDLCMIKNMNTKGHLEGTTEGCAFVEPRTDLLDSKYQVFSPWKGDDVLPFTLKTEHFGAPDFLSKLAYADILIYKNEDENPTINLTCQTLNGIEKVDEKVQIKINKNDWHGNTYRIRFTPNLNVGNAFDIGIYSKDKIGVQNICFYLEGISPGAGDHWQDNVVNEMHASSAPSMSL